MSLSISDAANLTNETIASGDLFPVLDISAASGSKGSHISFYDIKFNCQSGLATTSDLSGKASTGIYVSGSGLATNNGYLTGDIIINVPIASSGEAISGTSNSVGMTPLRTAQAIVALASSNISWLIKTGTYTASSWDKIQTNGTGGAFTITLPATPSTGDQVLVEDGVFNWANNNITLARNGLRINNDTGDYLANVNGGKLSCVYLSSSYGWSIK